jgi:hypothetical protein
MTLALALPGRILALALTGMTLSLVAFGAFNPNLIPNRLDGFKVGGVTGTVPGVSKVVPGFGDDDDDDVDISLDGCKMFVCGGNDNDGDFDVSKVSIRFVLLDGLEVVFIDTDDVLFEVFKAVVVDVDDVRVDDVRVGNNANADSNICSVLTGFSTRTFFGCGNALDGNAMDEIINDLFSLLISALSNGIFCREILALISSLTDIGVDIDVFCPFDDNDDKDNGDDDDSGVNFPTLLFIGDFSVDCDASGRSEPAGIIDGITSVFNAKESVISFVLSDESKVVDVDRSEDPFDLGEVSVFEGDKTTEDDEFNDIESRSLALRALAVGTVVTTVLAALGVVLTVLTTVLAALGFVLTVLATVLAALGVVLTVERTEPFEAVDSNEASTIGAGVEDTSFRGALYCHDFNSLCVYVNIYIYMYIYIYI